MELSIQQVEDTIVQARAALKLHPKDVVLHNGAAQLYEYLGRYNEALAHLGFIYAALPQPDEMLILRYVKALERTGQFLKALEVLEKRLAQSPGSTALLKAKALACSLAGKFDKAMEAYNEIRERNPSDDDSVGMLGYLKLLTTDMQQGYEEYAYRPLDLKFAALFEKWPRWTREPVSGKKLALWSEQGIGDVIMFMGLMPWLLEQGATVTLIVNERLSPLVKRSFPEVNVISESGLNTLSTYSFDYQLPLGDLLHPAMGYSPALHPPYLKADKIRAEALRSRYLAYAQERGRTKLIGLSWHTTNAEVGFTRNMTLSDLKPLLSLPDIQFVSLQYGNHAEEMKLINKQFKDVLFSDASVDVFSDLDGLAAQMSALDSVITIDNATVHLAGSLGISTTLLLSLLPDWRWGLSGTSQHWYGSVTLERQKNMLNWQQVIKKLRLGLGQDNTGKIL